ncbi:MAG TPA: hypothetical protein DCG28_01445 [Lachnospiraceae bacterium]|nr:hypothetical protein [Lachnospiraceae bacterium]
MNSEVFVLKRFIKNVFALILSTAIAFSSVSIYTYADTLTENICSDTSSHSYDISSDIHNSEVRFSSANYPTLKACADAGINTLVVKVNISSYQSYNGQQPGIMPFVSFGEHWKNNDVWVNVNNTGSYEVKLDFSSIAPSSTETLQFGVQIANVSGPLTYSIEQAYLTGESNGSSSGGSGSSQGNTTHDYDVDIEYNYAKLLQESLYLFDANMCGNDVNENSGFTWRNDCHTYDSSIQYNGKTLDLSGGYHDAGDHVKFGLPAAYASTALALSYCQFPEAYENTGLKNHYDRIMNRFVDYFERCTVLDDNGDAIAFCYQVGEGGPDHSYSDIPENQPSSQRGNAFFADSSKPATDIVCQTAAALAIHAYNENDTTAYEYSKKLFKLAEGFISSNSADKLITYDGCGGFYSGTKWEDDYVLAAEWLYKYCEKNNISDKSAYYNAYKSKISSLYPGWVWSWDNATLPVNIFLLDSSGNSSEVANYIKGAVSSRTNSEGYTYFDSEGWGCARYNCALQACGLMYDAVNGTDLFGEWAKGQMNYILGNNSKHICYVVGYNDLAAKNPHHRAAFGTSGFPNGNVMHSAVGSIVGGSINSTDFPDSTADYKTSEVALDYNASLCVAAAGLYSYTMKNGSEEEKSAQYFLDAASLTDEMRQSVVEKDITLNDAKGDFNNDGISDSKDTAIILKMITSAIKGNGLGDMNGNGIIELIDAIKREEL